MTEKSGVSLDFMGFRCLFPDVWFPRNNTIISQNIAVDEIRGVVIEDI
jgi:hypothetical protein